MPEWNVRVVDKRSVDVVRRRSGWARREGLVVTGRNNPQIGE